MVKWLHENRREGCTTNAIDNAASGGHISIVKYLLKNRREGFTDRAIIDSIYRGFNTVARLLQDNLQIKIIIN